MSEPRAWEGGTICVADADGHAIDMRLAPDKVMLICDRRDVLMRFTEDAEKATHHIMYAGNIYYAGNSTRREPKPWYTAIPVASLLQSHAEKAVQEVCRDTIVCQEVRAMLLRAIERGIEIGRKGER